MEVLLKLSSGGYFLSFLSFFLFSRGIFFIFLSSGGAKSHSTCQQKLFIVIAFIFKSMSLKFEPMAADFLLSLFSLVSSKQKINLRPIIHIFFFSCLSALNFISQLQQNNADEIGFCELWEIYQKNLKKFHFSLDLPIKI